MTTEYQRTPEEEAHERQKKRVMLSEAAYTILMEAESAADGMHLVPNYYYNPEEHDEATEKMRLAAAQLTNRNSELLAKLSRTALAASASIDPDNYETPVWHRVYRGNLHWYYRTVSSMVEQILQEKKIAERQEKTTER